MKSIVVIVVPHSDKSADAEAVLRKLLGPEDDMIRIPSSAPLPIAEDAEKLPLWRWFNF